MSDPGAPDPKRLEFLQAALARWRDELIDFSARNNLLYWKALRAGTLDLGDCPEVLEKVLAGKEVRMSAHLGRPLPAAGDEPAGPSWVSRARTIHRKSRELFEERGLQSLFLAYGMAGWEPPEGDTTAREPCAPLVLVPVAMEVSGADFTLSLAGDPRVNPTMLRKLRLDFGAEPDIAQAEDRVFGAGTLAELDQATAELGRAFGGLVDGFAVERRIVLSTFSYAKLPMVSDLESAQDELVADDLVCAFAGWEPAALSLRERNAGADPDRALPDHTPPADEFLVLDADASQSQVINAVACGRDLVVQGPPGTGKSQTIANLIATLSARGQTVLFVAEKRAAIDAVYKRLREVGLGQLLLDMHDGQMRRGAFAGQIAQALEIYRSAASPQLDAQQRRLQDTRRDLTTRAGALHRVREPWGVSVNEIHAGLAGLPDEAASEVRLSAPALHGMTGRAFEAARDRVDRWYQLGADQLWARDSAWCRSVCRTPQQAADTLLALARAADALAILNDLAVTHARDAGLPVPADIAFLERQLVLVDRAAKLSESLTPATWDHEDLHGLCAALAPWQQGGLSPTKAALSDGTYRAARKSAGSLFGSSAPRGRAARHELLCEARDLQQAWASIGASGQPTATESREQVRQALTDTRAALAALQELIDLDLAGLALPDAARGARELAGERQLARTAAAINVVQDELQDHGLGELLADLQDDPPGRDIARGQLEYVWLSSILEHLELGEDLGDELLFAGHGPHDTARDFQQLDRDHIASGPARVLHACAVRAAAARDATPEQGALVNRQARLKPRSPRHLTIREFFAQAPDVLRAVKPVWAMSPLVVSQTLPAVRDLFDVVIFDEASQVTPADAIPSILRGKRLVIAGDREQLPPTAFFAIATDGAGDGTDDGTTTAGTEGFQSILDAATGLLSEQMLTWHYRSRDERLIAFSNTHIYKRSLVTFPGTGEVDPVSHVHVPWKPAVDQNELTGREVRQVMDLVVEHALTWPDRSLGVIAMGIEHATRIDALLQRLRDTWRSQDPDTPPQDLAAEHPGARLTAAELTSALDLFLDEARPEAFFCKNLERVQGDERDRIILTIGYVKEPTTGRMLYRFGPLLQDGGERRLNVAITRAKQQFTVVSSFTHHDLDPGKLNKPGAKLLGGYLEFAASGGNDLGDPAAHPPQLNPFEIQIHAALTAVGIPLTSQLGVAGYRIDFAAQHPDQPGRYVLAIEADGASYHSSPTARDRDRLRQEQLQRLGWRFHRIWSTDWRNDQPRETQRALDAYRAALQDLRVPLTEPGAGQRRDDERHPPPPARKGARPIVTDRYDTRQLIALSRWILTDTLPRTRDELFADIHHELGGQRAGHKITAAINTAIANTPGYTHLTTPAGTAPVRPARPDRPQPRKSTSAAPPVAGPRRTPGPEMLRHPTIELVYQAKNKPGSTRPYTVTPISITNNVLLAHCHRRNDRRHFSITRITAWQPTD